MNMRFDSSPCPIRIAFGMALCALTLLPVHVAQAAPVTYTFTTAATPTGFSGLPALPFSGTVSGSFAYDASAPQTGFNPAIGAAVYEGSFASLAGSVAGHSFSDPGGRTSVSNDGWTPLGLDFLGLNADHAANNFAGFSIGGYTAYNIRMQWAEGQLAPPDTISDFLVSGSLPDSLPSFLGRLYIDLKPGTGSGLPMFVYYDSLRVTPASPIPEPASSALTLIALAALAMRRQARRS